MSAAERFITAGPEPRGLQSHAGDKLLDRAEVRDMVYGPNSGVSDRNIYKLSTLGIKIRGTGVRVRLRPYFRPNITRWWRSDVEAFLVELNRLNRQSRGEVESGGQSGGQGIEGTGSQAAGGSWKFHSAPVALDAPTASQPASPLARVKPPKFVPLRRPAEHEIGTYPRGWEDKKDDEAEARTRLAATDGEGLGGGRRS